MTEHEIRAKISEAIGRISQMPDDEIVLLMNEIKAYMLTLPRNERFKFYWNSGAEIIWMALPDNVPEN